MSANRSNMPRLMFACAAALLVVFVLFFRSADGWSRLSSSPSTSRQDVKQEQLQEHEQTHIATTTTTNELGSAAAGNSTLGFQKVLVLALKERSDKRDAMVLSSSLTGFDIEFVDGVKAEEIPMKARPDPAGIDGGALGAYRTHMNAIRMIIEDNLSSALIMEDDVDWDVRLRSQMPEFAKGVRALSTSSSPSSSSGTHENPYGDDWDVLWPGHCGEVPPEADEDIYIIQNDTTVAPKANQGWLIMLKDYPEQTRIVHRGIGPLCSFAYAVSRRGAQKLLLELGLRAGGKLAFDNSLADACRERRLGLKCYSIEPMLFFHHRPPGNVGKDSDIQGPQDGEPMPDVVREKGVTEVIRWSARLNLEQMVMGREYEAQW